MLDVLRIFRLPNYSGAFAIAMLVILIGGIFYMRLKILYNRKIWAMGSLLFCIAMISGQMWNRIRKPPFFTNTKNGPAYVSGTSGFQFTAESYLIMAYNAAVVLGFVLLIEAAGGVKDPSSNRESQPVGDSKQKRWKRIVQAIIGLILICVFFSKMLSLFRIKHHGYPYSFLFE